MTELIKTVFYHRNSEIDHALDRNVGHHTRKFLFTC